ncbi:hypothetical protein G6F56_008721 [Rhizopus delemar]|nr:hypothetical protein G6F56_008721 [Rhizopus delemar]
MSSQITPAISQMSTHAFANVDMSNPQDVSKMFQHLLNNFETLQQRVASHDDILNELSSLRHENATLKSEIANLNTQLQSALSGSAPQPVKVNSATAPQPAQKGQRATVTTTPSYAAAATRGAASKPVAKKRKLAACRAFLPVDPSAPRGFEYLYLNRTRKLSRAEVRRNLRLLGFDLSRLLDICFPGPMVIGLLVHVQYKEEVLSLLAEAKVPLVSGFDPLDPANLADPELQHLPAAAKADQCAELQYTRCFRALSRLSVGRPHLVGPIGKYFIAKGWIDEESMAQILSTLPSLSSASRSFRATDAGEAFRGDTDMSDASEPTSSGAESLSL